MNLAKVDNPPRRCKHINNLDERCPFFAMQGSDSCCDQLIFYSPGTISPRNLRTSYAEKWIREVNLCRAYWGELLIGDEKDQAWARPKERE